MRKIVYFLALGILMAACSNTAEKPLTREGYVDYLYKYMPLPDSLVNDRAYWEEVVDKTLEVRDKMNWGIPEREFRHFVLPVRVNNEDLDCFRVLYADELCERVKGMSLHDAVLEINHWCHEWATYVGTDARTRAPLSLMASGKGRCGEESTFTVSALRAAGIPARQVYTPLWAHTDSNHAWVEAWVDGQWYYLGACEPDPELNMGWFSAPVSRALLLHTKVSGDYKGPEDVIVKNPVYTEINVIRNYVPARKTTVTVVNENGNPMPGVEVEYKIFNYGSFGTVVRITTDAMGRACLDSGLGDMLVWASDGAKFGFAKLDREEVTLVLDHFEGEIFSADLDMVPPPENPLPTAATQEQIAANAIRTAYEDSLRAARHAEDPTVAKEAAFYAAVQEKDPGRMEAAKIVWRQMGSKDKGDVAPEVLMDAVFAVPTLDPLVLDPRVGNEMLYPCKAEIRAGLQNAVASPDELAKWMKENIQPIDESRNPQSLKIPPLFVWRSRMSDRESAKLFYVAACRALGWPAVLDRSGSIMVMQEGEWRTVNLEEAVSVAAPLGEVILAAEPGYRPRFGDFNIEKIENGRARRAAFRTGRGRGGVHARRSEWDDGPQEGPDKAPTFQMEEGYYMVTTGKRLPDGSVLARLQTFTVLPDQVNELPVKIRTAEEVQLEVVGQIDAAKVSDKPKFILAVVKENGEPTTHALRQLEGDPNAIIVRPGDAKYKEFKEMIEAAGCGADPKSLPYVIVADAAGKVYYFSQGYNTSLRLGIDRIWSKIK
ncbi:MAG: hypothetical protein II851_07085 [Bacteroidales bacterium]|nr:hypothetical protein [Bacteroidales bacterium]